MLTLILFLLFPIPEQNGKLVISTGVPGAEIYLDGNLVYTTDKSGTVPMEVPAGSFNLMIKKQGYKPYSSSFTIREGESKLIQPMLEMIRAPGRTVNPVQAALRSEKSSGKQSSVAVAKTDTKPDPAQIPIPSAGIKWATEPPLPTPQEESQESSVLPVAALLCAVVLLSLGFWIWKRKGDIAEIQPPDAAAGTAVPEPQENAPNRPEPPFIEELRRREELLKAGFVASQSRAPHQEMAQGKEVVIVLPKEAFRYEEDK